MHIGKGRAHGQTRIGDLFVDAGVIERDLVEQTLVIAKNAKLPLGRVLVMSGYLTDRDLECALAAQQMMREKEVTRDYVSKLVRLVHNNSISLQEAAALLAWEHAYTKPFSQVGKLLLAADIVKEGVLIAATWESEHASTPLGKAMVDNGQLELSVLVNVLNAMILVRDGKISRIEAIQALRWSVQNNLGLREGLTSMGLESAVSDERVRIGELLVFAGLIEEGKAIEALEISVENTSRIGEVLTNYYGVKSYALEAALQLQDMVKTGTLGVIKATELLLLVKELGSPLEELLAELDRLNQAARFIKDSGIIEGEELQKLATLVEDLEDNAGTAFLQYGLVSASVMGHAAYCLELVEKESLTQTAATNLLRYAVSHGMHPQEALICLGVNFEHEDNVAKNQSEKKAHLN